MPVEFVSGARFKRKLASGAILHQVYVHWKIDWKTSPKVYESTVKDSTKTKLKVYCLEPPTDSLRSFTLNPAMLVVNVDDATSTTTVKAILESTDPPPPTPPGPGAAGSTTIDLTFSIEIIDPPAISINGLIGSREPIIPIGDC